jgi:polysaccharide export outer membrane protein
MTAATLPRTPSLVLLLLASAAGALTAQAPGSGDSVGTGVRAGDVISVWVWREQDLTGEFAVDARGRVVLPMLGEVTVLGRGAEALAEELRAAYRRYLTNPSIRITVLRRVAVQGQVARPGFYPVDATVTIGNVIALAGGVSPGGDGNHIRLVRDGRVVEAALGRETVLERSQVQSGDEIFVPEKPWVQRNSAILLTALTSIVVGITVALVVQ